MKKQVSKGIAAILIMLIALFSQDPPLRGEKWRDISQSYQYNLFQWEVENLPNKWRYLATERGKVNSLSRNQKLEVVKNYFTLGEELASIENQIQLSRASLDNEAIAQIGALAARASKIRVERAENKNLVQHIMEDQVTSVLMEQGLIFTLPLGIGFVFPPVDFEFSKLPRLLIISPRNTIKLMDTVNLASEMSLETTEDIEDRSEKFDVSALVENIGGFAAYPAMIPEFSPLRSSLTTIAHEWLHHYLFFHPLGFHYRGGYQMTQINETVADIAGKEIGCLVYQVYSGLAVEDCLREEASEEVTGFDFNREMREIRLTVDQYLESGQIEEAEKFMEQKREYLQDNGYYIRKLNQAYFAFHGSYTDQPTSVSPIGQQLKELRKRSRSLGDFIRVVSQISSYQEYQKLVSGL